MAQRWTRRPEGSTWGDFGPDDQIGRLNLLTPAKVLAGVAEVREGLSFCLSLPLDRPGGNAVNPKRHPPRLLPVYEDGRLYYNFTPADRHPGSADVTCDEAVLLHSQYSTQWDSLAHVGARFDADGDGEPEAVFYNGYRAGEHVGGAPGRPALGARALGVENMAAAGVQGRAVLVDLHRHVGEAREAIGYERLREIMDRDGVVVEPGDVLLLHTGWDELILAMGGEPDARRLHASCAVLDGFDERLLDWVTESGVAAIATDNMAVEDARGYGETRGGLSRLPLHRHCLFRLGVPLGELWYLAELARALAERGRSRCLLTAPPLRLPGAVGSPVSPVATI